MACKGDKAGKSASNTKAHAKGTLVMDKESTVFLLHSLPRYPTRLQTGEVLTEFPGNAGENGQTFLCISATAETGFTIADRLNYINVQINKSVDKDKVNNPANQVIETLIKNRGNKTNSQLETTLIKSANGNEFTIFSKTHKNKVVPYDTTLREYYQDDFYVRTWTRPEVSPSLCDKYELLNVNNVNYSNIYKFPSSKEHSKWAVSKKKNICCFGDINHTDSQKNRGGNIVCFENQKLANIMRDAIEDVEKCRKRFLQMME